MADHRDSSMVAKQRVQGPKREIVQLRLLKANLNQWQESVTDFFNENGAIHLLYSMYSRRARTSMSSSQTIVDLTKELGLKAEQRERRNQRKERTQELWGDEDARTAEEAIKEEARSEEDAAQDEEEESWADGEPQPREDGQQEESKASPPERDPQDGRERPQLRAGEEPALNFFLGIGSLFGREDGMTLLYGHASWGETLPRA